MASGVPHIPKNTIIYLHREPIDFEVELDDGRVIPCKGGDYIAYNPRTNEVWPVSAETKDWYEAIPTQPG